MAALPPILLLLLSLTAPLLPAAAPTATTFDFSSFTPNTTGINYSGDAYVSGDNTIQLTRNQTDGSLRQSTGHAVYATPIQLRDPVTGATADFDTHFTFNIKALNGSSSGDGLAFFIAPVDYELPTNSAGGWLGLSNSTAASTEIVFVEFDTYMNSWDPDDNHIGINHNSVVSNATVRWATEMRDGNVGSGLVCYNSTTGVLEVHLTYSMDTYSLDGPPNLSYSMNLSELLPDMVVVGFSAAAGHSTELHQILSWHFYSSFGEDGQITAYPEKKKNRSWVVAVPVGLAVIVAGFGYFLYILRRLWMKRGGEEEEEEDIGLDRSMEDKLEKGTGFPRKFTYKELVAATKNFREDGKLGQGGFGGVYMGVLNGEKVAVKKTSRGSRQGKKEYVSEVTAIGRLRHRNLVRLIGWCHGRGEFMLVYEYMPNGSLDGYLFGKRGPLGWAARYRIAHGLAAALLYLQEEWEQCVVHRDVKSSNVMLDSGFNARLGDFGLARLVDHGVGSQTTVLAGTMGYMAPECVATGRASRVSDVYSFGVVALEIACGRKAVDAMAEEEEVSLVEWVWGRYGSGQVVEAADRRLGGEFDEDEMERLMVVGLWCAHPDQRARPTMRQAIQVLTTHAPLPSLPAAVPRLIYYTSPFDMRNFAYTSTSSGGELGSKLGSGCFGSRWNAAVAPAAPASETSSSASSSPDSHAHLVDGSS